MIYIGSVTAKSGPHGLKKAYGRQSMARQVSLVAVVSWLAAAGAGHAATTQIGNVTINLQTTLDYTLGERMAPVDNTIAGLNNDDGDKNFRSGIMGNRFQALEQLGIIDGNYGFRASAQGFLDTVYLQNGKNNSSASFNSYGVGPRGFPSATVATDGRRFEPLAAFIYGSEYLGDGSQKLSWQIGRQTITWGESLFSLDGISGLQAPVDTYQGQLEPNPQAQALFLPTGAASVAYNFGNGFAAKAYWQFEYEPDTIAGVGSYFSPNDFVGPGAQRILGSAVSAGQAASIYRAPDIRPANGLDQFGFAVDGTFGNYDVGAYYVRGIPKAPGVYLNAPAYFTPGPAGLKVGQYNIYYSQPVNAVALSVSTLIYGANVAGEISGRTNQPLGSEPGYTASHPPSYNDPGYAKGNVVDLQLSVLDLTPPLPLMPNGASTAAELTLNKVLSVTANKAALVPGNTSEGGAFEATFTPNWFPLSNVEMELPLGWGTTFLGDSQYDGSAAGSGTIDVGLEAVVNAQLTLGINYQRYYGPQNRQGDLDRDFGTFYVQRTF